VGTLPLRVFRQILVLRFVTGGLADGIRIDSEATSLKGTFSAYDYDALNPDVPVLKAPLSSSGGGRRRGGRAETGFRDPPFVRQGVRRGNPVELCRLDGNTR
jgi:hypothetical protein